MLLLFFFCQEEEGIGVLPVTGVQGCALPFCHGTRHGPRGRGVGGAPALRRQDPLGPQLLPEHDRQQGRVDPPRVPDEHGRVGPDERTQPSEGVSRTGGARHGGIVAAHTVSIKGRFRIVRRFETCYPYDTFKNHDKRLLLVGNQGTRAPKWRTRPSWTPSTGRFCGCSPAMAARVIRPSRTKSGCRDPP